jgi:hypothetical protein
MVQEGMPLNSEIIDSYCTATGIKINIGESTIYFMKVSEEDIDSYIQMFHYRIIDLQNHFKYLGFHIKPNNWLKGLGLANCKI